LRDNAGRKGAFYRRDLGEAGRERVWKRAVQKNESCLFFFF